MDKSKIEKLSLAIRFQSREIRRLEEEYDFLLSEVIKRAEMDLAGLLSKILNDKSEKGVFEKKFVKESKNKIDKILDDVVMSEKTWTESFARMTKDLIKLNRKQISNYEELKLLYAEPDDGDYSSQEFELSSFFDEIDEAIDVHNRIIKVYTLNKAKSKQMFFGNGKTKPL